MPPSDSQTFLRRKMENNSAKLPPGTEILTERGSSVRSYKITSTGKLIDDALEAIEKENGAERHRLPRRAARRVRAGARINGKLKGVLDRRKGAERRGQPDRAARRVGAAAPINTQLQIDPVKRAERDRLSRRAARRGRAAARINLSSLIDLIASIPFQHADLHADLHAKDILGHVFLPRSMERSDMDGAERCPQGAAGGRHQFALAEGKKGGHWSGATKTSPQGSPKGWRGGANQYFTPKSIVSLIVEMIEPYQGRVYDPAMGSGWFFVRNTRPSGMRFAKRCRANARGVHHLNINNSQYVV